MGKGLALISRKDLEGRERRLLCSAACRADQSKGRLRIEQDDPYRTCFQQDRDRILHSKSFRRLANKTQVFLAPDGDHYRTRLTHTLEVAQIAGSIARPLGLNEDLTEAVALGHDLGHTPFGHAGERALRAAQAKVLSVDPAAEGLFSHSEQSVRIVETLERDGRGLNLTAEVVDGILCHNCGPVASTLEGRIVALADRIAYVTHDMDDAKRAGLLKEESLPAAYRDVLGTSSSERIETMVHDAVETSARAGDILMSDTVGSAMLGMRRFLFENLYLHGEAKREEPKASHLVFELFLHFYAHPDELPPACEGCEDDPLHVRAADHVSSMTDRFAIRCYERINVPKAWSLSGMAVV
ncbi:deoxyguanosinetriphosphate triphosphohydrolase [Olsenella sp. HMSC062G07]|uniref:deoxyguanosinetriphosphate triphosphohydrolase n=1 Tax=Olsenella sp. HMSC062G07 TaxID=1739330 RepID=UPI0008A5CE92|nr:deoxyguanosinetriphosphate triphosphohydrolase [Olsenella sp. HMSC062G07]OFK24290.1 deoxyguanosinetriphosphate triphosphohydrolase [Olsenella sp. HMSC062G07]